MSAQGATKKKGKAKKREFEKIMEKAPKNMTKNPTNGAAAKKISTAKSSSPVSEDVKKQKLKANPAAASSTKSTQFSAKPTSNMSTASQATSPKKATPSPSPERAFTKAADPSNSRILNEVQNLQTKATAANKTSKTAKKPLGKIIDHTVTRQSTGAARKVAETPLNRAKHTATSKASEADVEKRFSMGKSKASEIPPAKPESTLPQAKSTSQIPLAALNSKIVSNLSVRGGARPIASRSRLPDNYKSIAKRYTATMIAIPILAVTSWVLYNRVFLNDDNGNTNPSNDPPTRLSTPAAVEKPGEAAAEVKTERKSSSEDIQR